MNYGHEEADEQFGGGAPRLTALPPSGAKFRSMLGRPAGLYPDPLDGSGSRLWDGAGWTSVTAPPGGPELPVLTSGGRPVNAPVARVRRGWFCASGAACAAGLTVGALTVAPGRPDIVVVALALALVVACAVGAVLGAAVQLAVRSLSLAESPSGATEMSGPDPSDPRTW